MEFRHKSVLLEESIDALQIKPDGIYVDGSLGGGGHSYEICRRLSGNGRLIGIDQDAAAIAAATKRLEEFKDRVTIVRSNYCDMKKELGKLGITSVDGVILDLGVSSYQLDEAERGFTYREDAPLDMRMDQSQPLSAREIVNEWSEDELTRILRDYGEENWARQIARVICDRRADAPIERTSQLVAIVDAAIPKKLRAKDGSHPARRTFQALRIAVNDELGELPPMLRAAEKNLKPGGRLAVITFHSLEDRIVKRELQALATGCTCPPEFPVCVCGKKPKMKLITRKPIVSGEEELNENPRARSAKLRVAEKC